MTSAPTSTDGQPLGARGIQTRQRILEAVAVAIEHQGLRGLRLADVAAAVGFSPPAFYQYFNDLDEAILALCDEVGHLLPPFSLQEAGVDGGDGDGDGDASSASTRPFIVRFFEHWDLHRAVLRTRNVAVTSGDPRFQEVRNDAFGPMFEALRARIEAGQREGRIDPSLSPRSLGAALTVMLDRVAMLKPQLFETWQDATPDELIDAVAYLFDRTLGVDRTAAADSERAARVDGS